MIIKYVFQCPFQFIAQQKALEIGRPMGITLRGIDGYIYEAYAIAAHPELMAMSCWAKRIA